MELHSSDFFDCKSIFLARGAKEEKNTRALLLDAEGRHISVYKSVGTIWEVNSEWVLASSDASRDPATWTIGDGRTLVVQTWAGVLKGWVRVL